LIVRSSREILAGFSGDIGILSGARPTSLVAEETADVRRKIQSSLPGLSP
jgi:hypothetical protein